MSSKCQSLADRLSEVLLNGRWIAHTNIREQINSITWEQATQKVGRLNSIAALTYHLNYYVEGINHLFNTGRLEIQDKFSFDFPPIENQEDWMRQVKRFESNAEQFIGHLKNMDDSKLSEDFVDKRYGTYQRNIEGVIEHSYYHFGQISLLKKLITSS